MGLTRSLRMISRVCVRCYSLQLRPDDRAAMLPRSFPQALVSQCESTSPPNPTGFSRGSAATFPELRSRFPEQACCFRILQATSSRSSGAVFDRVSTPVVSTSSTIWLSRSASVEPIATTTRTLSIESQRPSGRVTVGPRTPRIGWHNL
jgi:hypothetical protein